MGYDFCSGYISAWSPLTEVRLLTYEYRLRISSSGSRKSTPESDLDSRWVEAFFGLITENRLKLGASLKLLKVDGRNLSYVDLEETSDCPNSGWDPE